MEIVVSRRDNLVIVEPKGRIDSTTSQDFGARLLEAIKDETPRLLVDFSHVPYISSAGFRALLIAAKSAADKNCALDLCSLSAEVRRLFEIGAFASLFRIHASREEGITGAA